MKWDACILKQCLNPPDNRFSKSIDFPSRLKKYIFIQKDNVWFESSHNKNNTLFNIMHYTF